MAKRSATGATSAESVKSIGELAKIVDRDRGTVCRWLKRDDWPFAKRAPWPQSDVPKILRWVADNLERDRDIAGKGESVGDDADEMPALRREKLKKEIRKLHAQADAAETALARERGKLLDAETVESEWASIGAIIRNAFQNLSSQLVPLALSHGMPHEAAPEFQQQSEAAISGILRHLSRDGTEDN